MKIANRKSFTLVESLIAIILIGVIVVIFLSSLVLSFNYLRRMMEMRGASLILQEQVSIVRDLKFSEIESLGGTFSSSAMSALNNASGAILKSNYNGQDKIIKLTFKLSWTSFNTRAMIKTLVTLVTDHGINKK